MCGRQGKAGIVQRVDVTLAVVSVRCQQDEMPRHAIVYPADAPVPEQTAALEPALHLIETTGEWYEVGLRHTSIAKDP